MLIQLSKAELILKVKSVGVYMLIPIVNLAVSIFTTPLFAKYLTAAEFGYFGYYTSIANFLGIIFGLSLNTYYMSMYYRVEEVERKQMLISLTIFSLLLNCMLFPILYFGIYLYSKLSHSTIPFSPFALIIYGASAIAVYKNFVQIDYKLSNKPIKYTVFFLSYRVLTTLVSLYFLVYLNSGLIGRLIGAMVVESLFFLITLKHIFSAGQIKIDWKQIRRAFKFIGPLIPGSLLFLPLGSYDNIVLERLHDPVNMGLYNIGKSISYYLYLSLFSCYQVFEPEIYKNAVERNIPELKKIFIILTAIIFCGVLAFWFLSPVLINYLTAGKYNEAVEYANIWAITNGLVIYFSIFDAIILALQKSKKSLVIHLVSAVLCLTLYSAFGYFFKQRGIAIGAALTYFILVIMQAFFMIRIFRSTPFSSS